MKKSIMEKYFNQKSWSLFEILMVIVMLIAAIVATFVWGGGPIGFPLLIASIIALAVSKSTKIKDKEFDAELNKLATRNIEELDKKASITCFDLQIQPIVKGKDGKIRSASYVISTFSRNDTLTQIRIYRFDLLSGSCQEEAHTVDQKDEFFLKEEVVLIDGARKPIQYLECASFPLRIPVNTNEMDVCHIIEKLCDIEKGDF